MTLFKQGKYFLAPFSRDYGKVIKDDEILQHSVERDSIIAIYRNPDIPLDTLSYEDNHGNCQSMRTCSTSINSDRETKKNIVS